MARPLTTLPGLPTARLHPLLLGCFQQLHQALVSALGVLNPRPQQGGAAAVREGPHERLALGRTVHLLRLNPQQLVGDVLWGPEPSCWPQPAAPLPQGQPLPGVGAAWGSGTLAWESGSVMSIPGVLMQRMGTRG